MAKLFSSAYNLLMFLFMHLNELCPEVCHWLDRNLFGDGPVSNTVDYFFAFNLLENVSEVTGNSLIRLLALGILYFS
jgi:hypothetical protein